MTLDSVVYVLEAGFLVVSFGLGFIAGLWVIWRNPMWPNWWDISWARLLQVWSRQFSYEYSAARRGTFL